MAARKKKAKASKKAVKRTKARKAPAKKTRKTRSKAARGARPAKKSKASKKAAARKPAKKAPARKKKQTVGEGDYEASRTFLKDQSDFVKENKARIPELGRDARAALEGSEGPALLAAEAEARSHSKSEERPE
ncbi:MAG TPA: hypothetical protein VJ798_10840 [Rhizomicrobium sp.]|nr:hypothetical protein [Rhizomicrobium sp.]